MEKHILKLPDKLIKLTYSKHSKSRLVERTTGSLILAPQYVRLTKDNTIDWVVKNGRIKEATIILAYKRGVNMCLPIVINSGIVKTVFFKNAKKRKFIKKEFFSKEDSRAKANREFEENIQTQDTRTETSGERGFRENVDVISIDMGKKENWWQKLFRNIRRISRK